MRAVWSFWSRPYLGHYHGAWKAEPFHLMSWILSLHSVRSHFTDTVLHTDTDGARLLIDGLQLEFGEVRTDLDRLAHADVQWWALGKLHTYRAQEQPFLHVDSDVYLWRALDTQVLGADVITQNPEPHEPGLTCYFPERVEAVLAGGDTWVPPEWLWFRQQPVQHGECCGIFGGNDLAFIHHYSESALRLIEHPGNQVRWDGLKSRHLHNVLPEQYLLAACIEHRRRERQLSVGYVFPSLQAAFAPDAGRRVGFTHLIGDSKRDPVTLQRLATRVQRECPAAFERVWRVAATTDHSQSGVFA
jgi:hypothetical protein